MARFKDTDFLHVSARIRSREKKLLTQRQLSQMAEAPTHDEAWKLANDAGIGAGKPYADYEEALAESLGETYAFLREHTGGQDFLGLFRYEYDALNLKILVKAQAMGGEEKEELTRLGGVPAGRLREEFKLRRLNSVPALIADAVWEASDVLARTNDPQWVDVIVDKAMLAAMADKAGQYNIPFLRRVVQTKIDIANIRAAVRLVRMGKEASFAERVLSPGGCLGLDSLLAAYPKGIEGIVALLEGSGYADTLAPALPGLRAGEPLTAFERLCDDLLTETLSSARYLPFGVELLIVFALAREAEARAVRIVMASRLAGVAPALIKERLRETYA